MSITTTSFRLTGIAAIVLAASMPNAHAAAHSEGCAGLLAMVTDAGDNLRTEFGDAPRVAAANDDDACNVYLTRVTDAGGIIVGEDAVIGQQAVDVQTETETTETVQVEQEATIQGEVQVTLPDPQVDIEQQAAEVSVRTEQPDVTIDQAQPTITIRQAQPIITVEMAQPTITVEQPAPEIVITMPAPGVNVATAQPTVEVNIPEPRVTVTQGQPQLNVDLDTEIGDVASADPDLNRMDDNGTMVVTKNGMSSDSLAPVVTYMDADGEPNVSINSAAPQVDYEAAEPDVRFSSAGEPTIEVIQSGEPKIVIQESAMEQDAMESDVAVVQPLTSDVEAMAVTDVEQRDPSDAFLADPSDAAYDGSPSAAITVRELDGMDVINGRGEELGNVERVVRNGADTYVIVEHGGWFFGLNDKEVAFPVANVMVRGGEMVLRGMTEEQIQAMPDYDYANEVDLGTDESVELMSVQ